MPNDPAAVKAFADVLRRVLVVPFLMDDRIPGFPLPIEPTLHDAVEVEWREYPFPNEYTASIWLDKESADPLLLGIEFTWPNDPGPEGAEYQRKTIAYNVANWYLQVTGVIRAPFRLELEPPLLQGQSSTLLFETNHNGWGQCRVVG
jgi:hypothetical protein